MRFYEWNWVQDSDREYTLEVRNSVILIIEGNSSPEILYPKVRIQKSCVKTLYGGLAFGIGRLS